MCCAMVWWNKVEIGVVIRNVMRRRVVDSCSYHLRVLRARQVGHQLRRINTVLHQRAVGEYEPKSRTIPGV